MPRKPLVESNFLPYHVTARSNNREAFPLPLPSLWEVFGTECWRMSVFHAAEIQAFVLMPNHFHLIVTTPDGNLGEVMNLFMSAVTRTINLVSGRSGHVFGGPYHWTLIDNTRYYGHAFKYVYRNPVKGELVRKVEDYPFSSLHGLTGQSQLPFPIHLTRPGMEIGLPSVDPWEQLPWMNQVFPRNSELLIQMALRKKAFSDLKDRRTRKMPAELELAL